MVNDKDLADVKAAIEDLRRRFEFSRIGDISAQVRSAPSRQSLNDLFLGNQLTFGGYDFIGAYNPTDTVIEVQSRTLDNSVIGLVSTDNTGAPNGSGIFLSNVRKPPVGPPYLFLGYSAAVPIQLPFAIGLANMTAFSAQINVVGATVGLVGLGGGPTLLSSTNGIVTIWGDTVKVGTAARTPLNSAAPGNDGELCWDNNYVYIHSGGSWRRAALAIF